MLASNKLLLDQAGTMCTYTVTGCTLLPLTPQMVMGTV
jgi:hypothetical protein